LEELSSYQRIPLENLVKIVIGMCLNLDLHDRFVCLGTRVFETFDWSDFYYCAIDRSARSQSSYFFFLVSSAPKCTKMVVMIQLYIILHLLN